MCTYILPGKAVPEMIYTVLGGTLTLLTHLLRTTKLSHLKHSQKMNTGTY